MLTRRVFGIVLVLVVTNAEFASFVKTTGYVTAAERAPTAEEIMRQAGPGAPPPPPELLVAGSVVFSPTAHEVDLRDPSQWWSATSPTRAVSARRTAIRSTPPRRRP